MSCHHICHHHSGRAQARATQIYTTFLKEKLKLWFFFENCTSCQFSSNKAKIKAGFCRAIHRTHLGNWIRDKITGIFERHQDQESVIEKCEISWTIYHPVKIVSAHNCIHFVNGKQLGRILRRLLLRQPMSPPCIPWFKVYNKKYLTRAGLCMCKERGRNHNLVVNKKRNMKANWMNEVTENASVDIQRQDKNTR